MKDNVKVALADDHALVRRGMAELVAKLGYSVHFECNNGKELIDKLNKNNLPDIVLMDIIMPEMDGFETTLWLKNNYPSVKVLAVTMSEDDNAIIRMLKNGARGYIEKNTELEELKTAIDSIVTKGFHYSEKVSGRLIHSIQQSDEEKDEFTKLLNLNEKEIQFLKLASSDMTYKEIASRMHLSPRTIDGYRDKLLEKLNVQSRVGLVLFAIKNGIVQIT